MRGDELILRLEPDEAVRPVAAESCARPFDMTGRPMRGWLFVSPDGTAEDADLERWVRLAEAFASSLQPK